MPKITEALARNTKPKDKRQTFSDAGLILEVNPSGRKTFYHKYRQDGKQYKPKIGEYPIISVAEAKKLLLKQKHDLQIKDIKLKTIEQTFKQFVEGEFKEWLFDNNSSAKASYRTIEAHFLPYFGDRKIKAITPDLVERWKGKRLRAGISPATVTRNLTELRSIFSRVEDWYNLPSIMPKVKNPRITEEKEKLYLTDKEMEQLRQTCNDYKAAYYFPEDFKKIQMEQHGKDDKFEPWNLHRLPLHLPYIIQVAVNTGMRRGEILKLKFSDIDPHEKIITVRGSTEKTKRYRDIPISDKLLQELMEWYGVIAADSPLAEDGETIIFDDNRKVFELVELKRSWSTFRKRAGLEHVEFHTLRHNFASTLVLKGTAIPTIMRLMGHTNIKTTQRYLSVRREDMVEAVNLL